jgi:hypothetical protein
MEILVFFVLSIRMNLRSSIVVVRAALVPDQPLLPAHIDIDWVQRRLDLAQLLVELFEFLLVVGHIDLLARLAPGEPPDDLPALILRRLAVVGLELLKAGDFVETRENELQPP